LTLVALASRAGSDRPVSSQATETVAVLMTDLVGSSAIAHCVDPEAAEAECRAALAAFSG
jgi:class 3 adenylate cyclase